MMFEAIVEVIFWLLLTIGTGRLIYLEYINWASKIMFGEEEEEDEHTKI